MWQGAQTFGFLLVMAMDTLRDSEGNPSNNMTRALVMQAVLAGVVTLLAFGFRGKMARTEAHLLSSRQKTEQFCCDEEKTAAAVAIQRNPSSNATTKGVQGENNEKKAVDAATNCSTTGIIDVSNLSG